MKTKLCIILAVLLLLTPVLSACHSKNTCLACNKDVGQRYKDFVLSLSKTEGEAVEFDRYDGLQGHVDYSTSEELLEHIDDSIYYLPESLPEWITEAPNMTTMFREYICTDGDEVRQRGFEIKYSVPGDVKTKKGDLEYFRYAVYNCYDYMPDYPYFNGEWLRGGPPHVLYQTHIDDRFDTWVSYFNKKHGGNSYKGWTHKGDFEFTNVTFWDNCEISYYMSFYVKD